MICKFFKAPKNKSALSIAAVNYLLNHRVEEGTAKVLRGNEKLTKNIINYIMNKQTATVGCLSFTEKNIDIKTKLEIMSDFEKMLFPGLYHDEYNILWVEHTDKNILELNFVIPKINLITGKALQPYYFKEDQKRKDLWQQKINMQYNLTNPLDPLRSRSVEATERDFNFKSLLDIDKYLHKLVEKGELTSRDNLVALLQEKGVTVTRTGKEYISLKLPGSQKAKRFKGPIYSEDFINTKSLIALKSRNSPDTQDDQSKKLLRIIEEYDRLLEYKKRTQREKHQLKKQKENHAQNIIPTVTRGPRVQSARDIRTDRSIKQIQYKTRHVRTNTDQRYRELKEKTSIRFGSFRSRAIERIKEFVKSAAENIQSAVSNFYRY